MSNQFEPLFMSCKDWHNNACLNYNDDLAYVYIQGYKRAADELVNSINQTGDNQDVFVFPIVFLYRQHLELLLKNIIHIGRQCLDRGNNHPMKHELDELWAEVKGIIRNVWEEDAKEFKLIEHIINEIITIDPRSMAFRYPKNTNGKKHLSEIFHINTRHLSEMINKMSSFLQGVESGLYEYLNCKRYEGEYYSLA